MDKKKQVTANDVAKMAGVSPSTVSRVISNNPRISEPTRRKVLKCMEELGYYPNANARSLAIKKTGTVGIIIPTTSEDYFSNPFFAESLRGIIRGASKSGYDLLLSTNTEKGEELKITKKFVRGSKVDGIILMTSKVDDECIEYLKNIDFPFSIIGSTDDEKINQVDNDNALAAYELTKHLIEIGRKRIAMIVGDMNLVVSKKRIKGYKKALSEANIDFDENLLFSGSFDEKTGYDYGVKISKINPLPDGLIVADDLVAFGAVKAFEDLEINIPKDIAVASFNNSVLAKHSNIPLTSVDINAFELGREAMNLLVDAIEDEVRGEKITIPYNIYKRESTKG
ncbi:LacI family transcriptional regulator [Keratinibaculum paraultunense]|uniref:LacI family transcriptional regulator n=1 Tax=Keratinibaculum paraultunense TaxID=1278232 RepID=A0A4R3L0H3_9FIRM|nr:LacI family DNA-binding transcriptional regulator [Keratinibaculum paraultunense]QQY79991.1 LacI family DNA-binding transcriptional regulator [Keratinibaculum paraultunense]TCS91685.1 LacI family transcriptional regulator [Keratinibaculum paraultunense]